MDLSYSNNPYRRRCKALLQKQHQRCAHWYIVANSQHMFGHLQYSLTWWMLLALLLWTLGCTPQVLGCLHHCLILSEMSHLLLLQVYKSSRKYSHNIAVDTLTASICTVVVNTMNTSVCCLSPTKPIIEVIAHNVKASKIFSSAIFFNLIS